MTGAAGDLGAKEPAIRIGRTPEALVVEWLGIGALHAPLRGGIPAFVQSAGVDPAVLAKFRATDLLACRRYVEGRASLHAAAVALKDSAVVIVGESGAGKSTAAMGLVEHADAEFIADDVVPIDWDGNLALAVPVDDDFWLGGDAREHFGILGRLATKSACPPRRRAAAARPVRLLVHLTFDDTVRGPVLERLQGQEAFLVFSRAHISYSLADDEGMTRDFQTRARLAGAVPLFRLRRRRSISDIEAASRLLSDMLGSMLKRI